MSVYVCMSVHMHLSHTAGPNFTFSVPFVCAVARSLSGGLQYVVNFRSYVDDVMFTYN